MPETSPPPALRPKEQPDAAVPANPMVIYWKVFAWAGLLILAGGLIWLLSPVLLPFIIAFVLAYFLDPVVGRLVDWGLKRVWAGLLVATVTFGTIIVMIGLAVPFVVSEATALLDTLPDSREDAEDAARDNLPDVVTEQFDDIEGMAQDGFERLRDNLQNAVGGLAMGVSGIISVVKFWVVMPVVTVYLLIDWPRLIAQVDRHLPRPSAPALRDLAREIDATLSGYIRGQSVVCAILMGYYATALTLVGLPFAIAVGVLTGAVSFIPYVGMFIGTGLGIGVAIWQFWGDPVWIGAVAAIYAVGLIVESEVLVPRLVGDAVNLHPVWLIFAVLAFGTIFGFVGALLAVPLAAAAGVVARALLARYRDSALYKGRIRTE